MQQPKSPTTHTMILGVAILSLLCATGGCKPAPRSAVAGTNDLLSPEQHALVVAEAQESGRGEAPPPSTEKSDPGAPQITVVTPDITQPLVPPFGVELRFEAEDGATIDPSTFRVHYRTTFHDFDITDRVLKYMTVNDQAATASNIPLSESGQHRLLVEISDDRRRTGRRELILEVAANK